MNISKLIQSLNRAKKLRKALPFHQESIGGISVPDTELPEVLLMAKTLFKVFKQYKFKILINHWGEILIEEPNRGIKILLSIGYFERDENAQFIEQQLALAPYFDSDTCKLSSHDLQVRIKPARPYTKWRYYFTQRYR